MDDVELESGEVAEKKIGFDALKFVDDRKAGIPVTDADTISFSAYKVLQVLSMDPNWIGTVMQLNTTKFTKLPIHTQAKIFNGFNRCLMNTTWCRARTDDISKRTALIEKIMVVYGMTYNSAAFDLDAGLIDVAYVLEAYDYKVNHKVSIKPKRPIKLSKKMDINKMSDDDKAKLLEEADKISEDEDIKLIMQKFKINKEKAKMMLDAGINVDFLKNGLKEYLDKTLNLKKNLKTIQEKLNKCTTDSGKSGED